MIADLHGHIDYDERGEGPTIVLVPGSCSTGAAWRPIVAEWNDDFRCVTTSLLGYGGTAERRTPETADMAYEVEMLEAVIRRAGGPVHLVGHSFGATTALAVALRNRMPLLSLTLIEPPVPELLRHASEHGHYCAFRRMTGDYFKAWRTGEPAAIARMIDFYGGPGTFAAWPARVRDYAVATTPVNLLDWACAYSFHITPACLARIEVPTFVMRGGASPPAMQRTNGLVRESMPNASLMTLAGAAHFMIATHPREVAAAIARHVGQVGCRLGTAMAPVQRVELLAW